MTKGCCHGATAAAGGAIGRGGLMAVNSKDRGGKGAVIPATVALASVMFCSYVCLSCRSERDAGGEISL